MGNEYKMFLKNFIHEPKSVGSVTPSSRLLCKSMLKEMDFKSADCIVEYGAGTGVFTKEIIKRKKKSALFMTFELNEELYKSLKKFESKENNTWVINDSAEFVKHYLREKGKEQIDFVISGLPFTVLPKDMGHRIMYHTFDLLSKEGEFRTFQYSLNHLKVLRELYPSVKLDFQLFNIPPAFIYKCRKT
ncbi:rRNA adenine N-6-methyltransferase family protein [Serpentinicella sp. ANB-PHB4]|uniref:class I SAM-dependent methyltransferase n=1 Tax=Serpentinicella sp. ANB-PHB4 TaxID=3074076 RepID=UPI0028607839|nr:rRNA adenine N-6-methyltransferase family protein [Serpentinicella sp. ANB-PHB4]MDR5659283.1 rRNA adenine N-6-methyltransferase family protein [Serpentinicella sp. ANB-PHB4]